MSRLFYHTCQDNLGNLLFDVSGTMRLAGTGTLATIYGDEALTVILPNPMTNHPSFGSFKCFLPVGDFDFYLSKSGYTFETLTGVQGTGTMAQQDAASVAITGGSVTAETHVVNQRVGNDVIAFRSFLTAAGGSNRWSFYSDSDAPSSFGGFVTGKKFTVPDQAGNNIAALVGLVMAAGGTTRNNLYLSGDAPNYIQGKLGLGQAPGVDHVAMTYARSVNSGFLIRPDADAGAGAALYFLNAAGGGVGGITTTGAATTYATTSDARLKHNVADLTGELALIQALRPVSFRWNADNAPGVGFLAHEVAAHVQGIITGEADAVHEDGSILPQMIDYSKLVPFLTGAVKTLAAQVESLTARLVVLEDALGI